MNRVVLLMVVIAGLLLACNDDPKLPPSFEEQLTKDRAAIDAYLVSKGINAQLDPDDYGVKYVIAQQGTGIYPTAPADSITVNYAMKLIPSETEIEKSSAPVRFLLGGLIPGWQIGVPLINVGSKATFFIPSVWGYGSFPVGDIPANSNLIYEIELLKVFPQIRKDTLAINDYLAVKAVQNVLKGPSGLKYVITTLGTGPRPVLTSTSTVTYSYTGKILGITSEVLFDQSTNPLKFDLSKRIRGFQLAFPLLPVGTKATLYIPSVLGYGLRGVGSIVPSNANLIYDIELTATN
jgi:FKBP-type peptidyl-prolyl cis-trans isomerase FkpA